MSLHCIKTGFYGYCVSSGLWLHGDAFILDDLHDPKEYGYRGDEKEAGSNYLLLRICSAQPQDEHIPIQIYLRSYEHWFDDRRYEAVGDRGRVYQPNSTLIAEPYDWKWFGYKGQEIKL